MTAVPNPALVAELERRCLRGLAAAAGALAGGEASAVCATFAAWLADARRPWPWLPGLCFGALEPLGVSFPDDDEAAIVLGRMLIAAETDAGAAERALAALDGDAGDPTGELAIDAAGSLRRRSLLIAVDRFWEDLTATMHRVHEPVVRGDRDGADWIIVAARRQLEDERERLRELTRRVAEDVAPSAPAPGVAESPALPPSPELPPSPDHQSAEDREPELLPETAVPAPEADAEPESHLLDADGQARPDPYAELAQLPPWGDADHGPDLDETQLLTSDVGVEDPDATGPIDLYDDMEATGPLDELHPPEQVPPAPPPGPGPVPSGPPSRPRTSGAPRHHGPSPGAPRQPPRPEDVEYRRVREHTYAPIVFVVLLVLVALVVVATVGTPPG